MMIIMMIIIIVETITQYIQTMIYLYNQSIIFIIKFLNNFNFNQTLKLYKSFTMSTLDITTESVGKELSELNVEEVGHLMCILQFNEYKEIFLRNRIDGKCLEKCISIDDVINMGINITVKARLFFDLIMKFKVTGVPDNLLFEMTSIQDYKSPDNIMIDTENKSQFAIDCNNNNSEIDSSEMNAIILSGTEGEGELSNELPPQDVVKELFTTIPTTQSFIDGYNTPSKSELSSAPSANSSSKPLSELSLIEVGQLLESLSFEEYKEVFLKNKIDGITLIECLTVDDIKEAGIMITMKAKQLYKKVMEYKSTGVPLNYISINIDNNNDNNFYNININDNINIDNDNNNYNNYNKKEEDNRKEEKELVKYAGSPWEILRKSTIMSKVLMDS